MPVPTLCQPWIFFSFTFDNPARMLNDCGPAPKSNMPGFLGADLATALPMRARPHTQRRTKRERERERERESANTRERERERERERKESERERAREKRDREREGERERESERERDSVQERLKENNTQGHVWVVFSPPRPCARHTKANKARIHFLALRHKAWPHLQSCHLRDRMTLLL